jgi:hypothetical protein
MSPSAHPALRVHVRDLCSADCTSLCKPRNRRDPSRRPCGHRGPGRRHAMGPEEQRASCAQKQSRSRSRSRSQEPKPSRNKEAPQQSGFCSALAEARTTRAALDLPGTHRIAAAADDQARRVGAGRADSAGYRTYLPRNPAAAADPARTMRAGRYALGRVLWVTFLARARKVTRSAEGRAKALALNNQDQNGFPLDSRRSGARPSGHSLRECSGALTRASSRE